MPLRLETRTGDAIAPVIADLASLRCAVFRDFPYLYDGDEAYERRYLAIYQRSQGAAVIVARDGGRIVGASTCLPMADEEEAIQAPLRARGIDTNRIFYFGESVLLPEYRGHGAGVGFFEAREAHARAQPGIDFAVFASVLRPADHPARPASYQPLDAFWTKRGFVRRPDLICHIAWKELGETGESEKPLVLWMKSLSGAPLP